MGKFSKTTLRSRRTDSTIALINIVFLMLIFFLIAGTISPPMEKTIKPVETSDASPSGPPDGLAIDPDGQLYWRGAPAALSALAADGLIARPLRILVDRALPGSVLVDRLMELRQIGIDDVVIVTEKRGE